MKYLAKQLGADKLRFKSAQINQPANVETLLTTIEKYARENGHPMTEMTLDEMEELWQEAKRAGL